MQFYSLHFVIVLTPAQFSTESFFICSRDIGLKGKVCAFSDDSN